MKHVPLLPPPKHRARLVTLWILALAPFAFGALAVALGQDTNWDFRNYHWYNAYAFLNGRFGFDLLPAQTPTFYNPLLDVPFYLLATHVPAKVAAFTLGFVQGFNFILLFMLAYMALTINSVWRKTLVCVALALLGMLGGGGIALIGTTFYDNVTSLGIFTSGLLVIRYRERLMSEMLPRAFGRALLFGIPVGLMMGLKLPSVIFCVGFCFGILFMGGSWRRLFMISFAFGTGVLLGVTISLGWWAWFLQTHFHNPFFPYFNDIFKSPLISPSNSRDEQFLPHGFWNNLLFPFHFAKSPYMVGEIEWRDWRIPILYGLLPAAILARLLLGRARGKNLVDAYAARYLLATAAISYFVWYWMFAIYRYAVPLEMIAPLAIVMAVDFFPLKRSQRAVLAACIFIVIVVTIVPGNWSRRATWLHHFVEVQIPPLPEQKDLMILMAGIEPYSHVVPEFPPAIPFVRIQSNFISPEENKDFNRIIRARVEGHNGPFMLLIPTWQESAGDDALAIYHLARVAEPCQTVIDRLYDDKPLSLCKLIRKPG